MAPLLLVRGYCVFRMADTNFSVLEINDQGIRLRKVVGSRRVPWIRSERSGLGK